jgi:hypothetical protein
VKAATDLAKYVKLHSEDPEITKIELDSNQTIVQIIFAITKVTVERPVVIMYRRGKGEYSGTVRLIKMTLNCANTCEICGLPGQEKRIFFLGAQPGDKNFLGANWELLC